MATAPAKRNRRFASCESAGRFADAEQNPAYRSASLFSVFSFSYHRLTLLDAPWYISFRRIENILPTIMELPFGRSRSPRPRRYRAGRRGPLWPVALIAVAAISAAAIGLSLANKGPKSANPSVSKQGVLESWAKSDWASVIQSCDQALDSHPLDVFYLGMRGVADFYDAMTLPPGNDRDSLLSSSIFSIRKALSIGGNDSSIPRGQLEYVLAKAYYHSDASDLDLAAGYLSSAQANGYSAPDMHEYLGMIDAALGDDAHAKDEFAKAMASDSSPLLLIAAASVYARTGDVSGAEGLLKSAIASTQDAVASEKARLALAQIYFGQSRWDDCEAQLTALVTENPQSAEAHYQLGLLYQAKGDPIHARAEWRKAVSIDPMHAGARQKLAERS